MPVAPSSSISVVLAFATSITYILFLKNKSLQRKIKSSRKKQPRTTSKKISRRAKNDNLKLDVDDGDFQMKEIGRISAPFGMRAGTPRQGLLAQHTRSILTLHLDIPKETVDDLDQYSHVWIIFKFHLNPIGKGKSDSDSNTNLGKAKQKNIPRRIDFTSSKVKPPRAGGKKVGVFATRSPHRPNNVGLSLAKLESVESVETIGENGKKRKKAILKLLGLDLVDETPVYDIKPYLPSDVVTLTDIRSPSWVNAKDELASVQWTDEAKESLIVHQRNGMLEPFYGRNESNDDDAFQAISEVIAQDPRAQHEGRGIATRDGDSYKISFCSLRIEFTVEEVSDGFIAKVRRAINDEGDAAALPGSYQYNLALKNEAGAIDMA
mmetsp:Transcript_12951/g.19421  ORF Transcript_12951/g.19421 Transcript_12951/m.19421 type:complete len:379 (-) Transcript_12951:233-1369(-)